MSKPFDRLQSVLKLEAQQGYKNKAVVGGIRQFVSFWVEQARSEMIDEADGAFIEQTAQALTDYGQMSGSGRKMLVDRLIDKLTDRKALVKAQAPAQAPPNPPKAKPSKKPAAPPQEPDTYDRELEKAQEKIDAAIDACLLYTSDAADE